MTPIIVPVSSGRRGPSPEELARRAAEKAYTTIPERDAFMAGARWERGSGEWPFSAAGTLLLIFIIVQIISFLLGGIAGMVEGGSRYKENPKVTKWVFVAPAFYVGFYAGIWMSTPIGSQR